MIAVARRQLTIGLHSTTRGFGWIAFEGPFAPFDWGLVTVTKDKNPTCLRRIERLLRRLEPETLVVESFEVRNSTRSERIRRLYQAVVALAADHSIGVAIFTRPDVEACFRPAGARTRHEIAAAVARCIPALRVRLPSPRRLWDAEDWRMALFSAAALVLTSYHLDASSLLDQL